MSAEKNITRKDVAEKAGVSVSVVSRVLNNSGYVDKEKKKKIIKIAEQLGYVTTFLLIEQNNIYR